MRCALISNISKFGVVITAGGSGQRMGGSVKKQYINLNGKPILYYPLALFANLGFCNIVLVIPENDIKLTKKNIIEKYNFKNVIAVSGGVTRHHSVFNGLSILNKCKYVLIHDGVRPLVTKQIIYDLCAKIQKQSINAVIPVVSIKDTIKKLNNKIVEQTIDRSSLAAVQTPQAFKYKIIMDCYKKSKDKLSVFTDDASIVEANGYSVLTVNGDDKNIKITLSGDLELCKFYLSKTSDIPIP